MGVNGTDFAANHAGITQQDYQWFSDDAGINLGSAKAAKNVPSTVFTGTQCRLRVSVQCAAGDALTARYGLEYQVNGAGAWVMIDSTVGTPMTIAASPNFADGAATTQRLGATTFVAGEGIEANRNSALIALSVTTSQTEIEWCLLFPLVGMAAGDVITFRVVHMSTPWTGGPYAATLLGAYTNVPTITIAVSSSGGGGVRMPERATVYESLLLGVETTPGTAVTANKRLLCCEIDPDNVMNAKPYRVMGNKFASGIALGKEFTSFRMVGDLCFNDALYQLASCCALPAITTPANNGVWTVAVGAASAGTFTLTYGGQTTTAIAFNATAATVQAAIAALTSVGAGNVVVTGAAPTWIVTFVGWLSTGGALTGLGTGLTGGAFTATTTAATNTRRWTMSPVFNAPDTLQTYSAEKGVAGVASLGQRVAYAQFTEWATRFSKDEASVSGALAGQTATDPYTINNAAITDVVPVLADPARVSVFLGDAFAGVGAAARLLRCLEAEFGIGGRARPLMTLDESAASFSAMVEGTSDWSSSLTVEHEATSQTLLAKARAKVKQRCVIECRGQDDSIEVGYPYRLKISFPCFIVEPARGSTDDVVSQKYTLVPAYDGADAGVIIGGGLKIEVDTKQTAL